MTLRSLLQAKMPSWLPWAACVAFLFALVVDIFLTVSGGVLQNPQLEANPVIRGILMEAGLRGFVLWITQEVGVAVLLVANSRLQAFGTGWSLFLAKEHVAGALSWLMPA